MIKIKKRSINNFFLEKNCYHNIYKTNFSFTSKILKKNSLKFDSRLALEKTKFYLLNSIEHFGFWYYKNKLLSTYQPRYYNFDNAKLNNDNLKINFKNENKKNLNYYLTQTWYNFLSNNFDIRPNVLKNLHLQNYWWLRHFCFRKTKSTAFSLETYLISELKDDNMWFIHSKHRPRRFKSHKSSVFHTPGACYPYGTGYTNYYRDRWTLRLGKKYNYYIQKKK